MEKSVLALIGGICLGILMMIGVFYVLNMKPDNEDVLAQSSEEVVQDIEIFYEEVPGVTENSTETEFLEMTETTECEETVKETNKTTATPLPYYIRVNRLANCVTVYTMDVYGNYTVPVKAMTCSVGLTGETPLGVSKITSRYEWRLLFGNTYGHYTVRFNGHILFHSVPYMATSNDTLKEGQFNMLGQPASQGCVRLCVADAKWIYDNCANGTIVEVYDSYDPGPLGKPVMPQINMYSPFRGWDPTDPNPNNPWLYGTVSIGGVKDITINAGESIDLLDGVWAVDMDGLGIPVVATGNVDTNVPGVYTVTYTATGVLGASATMNAVVTVNPVYNTETVPPVIEQLPTVPEEIPPVFEEVPTETSEN